MNLTTHTMQSWDGAEIFYRAWLPPQPTTKAVLLFHRGHEHSGCWEEMAASLDLGEDVAIFAWDQRGHGKSAGERGHAPNVAAVVKDVETFARHLVQTHGVKLDETVVVAHSIGASIAATWVHDYAPPIRGMVLGAPAFRVKLYVPFAVPALRLKKKFLGRGEVKSYVKANMLTHDKAKADVYRNDPLVFRQIAVNMLLDLHDTSTRLLADAGAITTPTLILAAEKDWVVKTSAQQQFYERISSRVKQFEVVRGAYHSIFQETSRSETFAKVRAFVLDCFVRPSDQKELVQADRGGYTRTEFDLLRSTNSVHWKFVRGFLKSVGRLSNGVRLGWKSGFDSGLTLDYVYDNKPAGFSPIGKIVDNNYLNSIGWRGIRIRQKHIEKSLQAAIDQLHSDGRPVRILDIASGPGRYVLETIKKNASIPITATLRDYKQENLDAAKTLAEQNGVSDRVTIVQGDAFDRDSLATIQPRPTIAIVSGLYELFPDNCPLRRSLDGLAAAVEEGGFLVYTCQPWHPQIEFIAKVLRNREGQPWIMRRRTQAEMDELVRAAGFEKISQEIDQWGIFTVSVARRGRTG